MYNDFPLIEIQQLLAERFDEVSLLEILEINSHDLVERFYDKIENNLDKYIAILEADSIEGYDIED